MLILQPVNARRQRIRTKEDLEIVPELANKV